MTEPLPGEVTAAPDEDASFEGPRRRARREREERRAAQARARAIEDARRQAKRKLTESATDTKPVARGAVRGLRVLTWTVVLVIVAVGLGLVLYFTPLMSMRNLIIDGIEAVRRVAEHAEAKDHHPDIDIRWRTVTFALVTHSEGGITKSDVAMARDINGIVGS